MSNQNQNQTNSSSSPFPSCFRRTNTGNGGTPPPPPPPPLLPPISAKPNLTTSLYQTNIGLFALTWSRSLLGGRSLNLHLFLDTAEEGAAAAAFPSLSAPSFHLQIKPFIFWNKHGHKKLNIVSSGSNNNIHIYWDLSKCKFGSGPEPQSGFYIAVVADGVMTLLVGDSPAEAYSKTRVRNTDPKRTQTMVLRREHVYGSNRLYTTRANFGGKIRNISIECRVENDPALCFSIDRKRVLQIKHLKWKFRGNERIEVDGIYVQVSWDVYNWLFEEENEEDRSALFMFKFEKEEEEDYEVNNGMMMWAQHDSGRVGFERKKMKKGRLGTTRSSSSSSLSSASSSCSSVMEWASVEENELRGPSGFCLLVYAWKN